MVEQTRTWWAARDDRAPRPAASGWIGGPDRRHWVIVDREPPSLIGAALPNRQLAGAGVVVRMLQHHRHKVHAVEDPEDCVPESD